MLRVLATSDLEIMEQHRNSRPRSSPLTCRQRNTSKNSSTMRPKSDSTSRLNSSSNFTSRCCRRKLMTLKRRKKSSTLKWQRKSRYLRKSSRPHTRRWQSRNRCRLRNFRKRLRDCNKNWPMKALTIVELRIRAHLNLSSQDMPPHMLRLLG